MIATIEALESHIDEVIELYGKIEATGIPATVKEAVADNWELYVDQLELAALTHYAEHERHKDSQRIIPMEAVLRTVREMEEDLIDKTVLDPLDIYFRTVAGKWKMVKFILEGLSDWRLWWDIIKAVAEVIVEGERGIVKVLANVLEIAAVVTIAKLAMKVIKNRDSWCDKMRKRALPVPKSTRRVRVEKLAR